MTDLVSTELRHYLESLVPPRLAEMLVMERYAMENRFPIIGPVAGYFCYQLARMVKARAIFEMGSGYGYSTAWFARAVQENGGGSVHHVVWYEELSIKARGHLSAMGFEDIIHYTVGEAVQVLEKTQGSFDLIFNDIDKAAYPDSLPVVKDKLRSGGVLLVDNALWRGRIFDGEDLSATTEGIRELTRRLSTDPEWISSIMPLRDGLIVAMKR